MNGDQLCTSLFCFFGDTGHCKVVNAHAVGQADTLVFDRRIVVVVMTAEHSRRAAKPDSGIEQLARKIRTAYKLVGNTAVIAGVLSKEVFDF